MTGPHDELLRGLRGGLIVSCQARPDDPLHGPEIMAAMAAAAEQAGAVGIRANGPADVAAIRRRTRLPIIGILKVAGPDGRTVITPDFASARAVCDAGAAIVALSAARIDRPDQAALAALIRRIRVELGAAVMADCATVAEGMGAAAAGADLVATTLSGYTPETADRPAPDLDLVRALATAQGRPVVAEGRIATPEQAAAALRAGAFAVVVGTAITNPRAIAARFVTALAAVSP
ncbi:MAG: putative N-acetylmannosamine-6-phosphate 2-epimerase [Armatimonadota bacterium]|nr:putative N-acetylmannosamine-6-phosphate 2-epimerase [Armatimonadota bacterium]MDR7453535.1 putative N-acetylmannosamine-6-phosphate 2-epimerase [Armatimonadota bacterium]MDR7455674.1 putative N-acetylmannosamine-6-phosphate 2-epimerase [Armatimonadota bacterium]MDR7497395.1 putative N-acetylmannosamine-6-phosphate 2-epimerase [Armatimonadota bacterium]MDR7511699.1 putative N-acetylmannosamine-6-phosphate 2-epimerase [Armatimonadota bacterium]